MTIAREKKIVADLAARNLEIGGIVAVDPNTHELVFLTYDVNGLVSNIAGPDNTITLYGKDSAETRAMHELLTISATKPK